MKKGTLVHIISGKHKGKKGTIQKNTMNQYKILLKKGRSVQTPENNVENCLKHPSILKILSTNKFKVDGKTYTLEKTIATGTFGVTMSANYKGNEIAVKAILPTLEKLYQIQELETQYYLTCMFGELKAARFPETYFLAQYKENEDDYLQLMYDHDITDTPVAGMEYLRHNLAQTLSQLRGEGNTTEMAKLARDALTAVATTLDEVNRQISFVHGDLHVANIMHQNGMFYIIDFGATRLDNGHQLPLKGYYDNEIGSSGLDLLTLSLSIADWCDKPIPNLLELWYPLWKFYKTKPVGRYKEFRKHQKKGKKYIPNMKVVVKNPYSTFLNPRGPCFLGTGYKTTQEWPLGEQFEDNELRSVETWHYYGYAAGDINPNVASIFEPGIFLNYSPEDDVEFLEIMASIEPGLFESAVSAIINFFTFDEGPPQFRTYVYDDLE